MTGAAAPCQKGATPTSETGDRVARPRVWKVSRSTTSMPTTCQSGSSAEEANSAQDRRWSASQNRDQERTAPRGIFEQKCQCSANVHHSNVLCDAEQPNRT